MKTLNPVIQISRAVALDPDPHSFYLLDPDPNPGGEIFQIKNQKKARKLLTTTI